MTNTERVELILIGFTLVITFIIHSFFPSTLGISELFLYLAALLLVQGLVRDLWYLSLNKKNKNKGGGKHIQCMCVESTVGMFGILMGLILYATQIDFTVSLNQFTWVVVIGAVLIAGFIIKDYVIEWNPWRIYKEKDHMNIVFSWKKTN